MKTIFLTIIVTVFLIGCTSSYVKDTNDVSTLTKVENSLEPKYQELYERWDLEGLEKELDKDEHENGIQPVMNKYRFLMAQREIEKRSLLNLMEQIKIELKNNDTTTLQQAVNFPGKSIFLKKAMKDVPFDQINILFSDPEYLKNTAKNIIGFNYMNKTAYFDAEYILKNSEWKIYKFQEKR